MKRVLIKNLPFSVTQESFEEMISKYGPVERAILLKDETGKLKGEGYLEFVNEEDANKAMELDGVSVEGRTLKINILQPRDPKGFLGGGVF